MQERGCGRREGAAGKTPSLLTWTTLEIMGKQFCSTKIYSPFFLTKENPVLFRLTKYPDKNPLSQPLCREKQRVAEFQAVKQKGELTEVWGECHNTDIDNASSFLVFLICFLFLLFLSLAPSLLFLSIWNVDGRLKIYPSFWTLMALWDESLYLG